MSSGARKALLIGVERYDNATFTQLPSCRADVWAMNQVLRHPAIGRFDDVRSLPDPTAVDLRQEISSFLEEAAPADLVLLYLSCHGFRLRFSSGEFFFVARDTDPDRPAETAVSAGFVNEQLEGCRAARKVTIIDACDSGGFAVGLRTRDEKGGERTAPLQSRGVYVLSSSGVGEASYGGPPGDSGAPTPSVFTAEIVRALQTGAADHDGDGKVSVEDLFHYVAPRVRAHELGSRQAPVYSSVGVNSKVIIADVISGGAVRLEATPADLSAVPGVRSSSPKRPEAGEPLTVGQQWARLLDYYRACLESLAEDTPLLRLSEEGDRFVVLQGRERVLSGGADGDDQVVLTGDIADWARRATASGDELWAGFPAVLLYGPADRQWREPRFAPLLVRRVEVVDDGDELRLEAVGPAQPHPGLARERLGPEPAEQLLSSYFATWHAGSYGQMVKDIRAVLQTDFELPMVEELRPELLAPTIDQRTPTAGARNVAVLHRVSRRDQAVAGLLKDLAHLRRDTGQIGRTALGALLTGDQPPAEVARVPLVTPLPCNESQQAVISSAMTARLTVATGPPGSGKSQLVTNTVATAVAAGQKVLVASTNNTAVDEVWRRCRELLPGLLVRTGSRTGTINYAEHETAELTQLTALEPAATNPPTARAALVESLAAVDAARVTLAGIAALERDLLHLAQARERLATELGGTVEELTDRFGGERGLARWERRARRAAEARLFGTWRRQRLLRSLRQAGPPMPETCRAFADLAAVQRRWTPLREQAVRSPADGSLAAELARAEEAAQRASVVLVDSVVRTSARTGRHLLTSLLRAKRDRTGDWPAVRRALDAVRGWAVSSLSARRFPAEAGLFDLVVIDEASQCSVPQVIPLLFRARRALVIGDPMQLPHIPGITPDRETAARRGAGLRADWLEARQLAYRRHSAFHAVERAAGGSRLLDEHYRCHPQIADLVNRLFYGGRLTVLTDTRRQHRIDRDPVVWVPVAGQPARPPYGGSWVNAAEAEKIHDCLAYLLKLLPAEATVGVVTPYKAQAERLAERWRHEPRIRIGTAHTFQGGERDVIVLGLVAGPAMPASSVAWLEGERNLWNVALSRARGHLLVVGDRQFWATRRGVGADLAAVGARAAEAADDPVRQRLYSRLTRTVRRATDTVTLDGEVNGHRCDALVSQDAGRTAVVLDRSTTDRDLARHLRVQYRRVEILTDEQTTAVRLPAWRLYDRADG
ncbi:AAA domain-containing protein [Micromonospora sp. FIMYZ51]|uniref:caspase, EACC1-associated type n=1 Tax=Micromonospora sp. FIMYZ51 TaxID=3051832 RepID=UPI00311E85D8